MKANSLLLALAIIGILISILYIHRTFPLERTTITVEVEPESMPVPVLDARPSVYSERIPPPEYRPAPVREWKPTVPHQMGLLTDDNGDIKPLYGRASRTHRDRWHYWTTTGGENLYPLPIEVEGRSCEEDIGCQELFGNEQINILGKENLYKPTLYRVDDYF